MEKTKIENGMYVISKKQEKMLKELANSIQKIDKEIEKDNVFRFFIASLGISNTNLFETLDIIQDITVYTTKQK